MFYKITGGVFRSRSEKDTSFSIHDEFRDDDILVAREKCFMAFHSYVEVFLQGVDSEYEHHVQATVDLQDFFVSHRKRKLEIINDDNFIQISFVFDETIEFVSKDKKVIIHKGDIAIHGMEKIERYSEFKNVNLRNLIFEKSFFKENDIKFNSTYFDEEPNKKCKKYDIINTPIDFDWIDHSSKNGL